MRSFLIVEGIAAIMLMFFQTHSMTTEKKQVIEAILLDAKNSGKPEKNGYTNVWNQYLLGVEVNERHVDLLISKCGDLEYIESYCSESNKTKEAIRFRIDQNLRHARISFAKTILEERKKQIDQLQAENAILRNQLGISKNMSAEEVRCHIFRHRLIGLLVRAKDGYDYRLPFNHEEYMKRFTVSRTADGVFTQQHGFPKEDWLQVKGLIDECIELLSGIGPVTAANREQWNVISSKITQMFGILNFNRFSKDTTENKQEYAARKIKVGRTLQKLLDTIGAYLAEEELPLDPPEIINNEENLEVVTIENMCAWLKKAAK
jgi:hypothetical protein